jgi:hypothetical protein
MKSIRETRLIQSEEDENVIQIGSTEEMNMIQNIDNTQIAGRCTENRLPD